MLVEVCILGAQVMLHTDKTLATTALRWFLKPQYPSKNLQLLRHHFPDEDAKSLESARKLLTEYYHQGCRRDPSRKFTFRGEMENTRWKGTTSARWPVKNGGTRFIAFCDYVVMKIPRTTISNLTACTCYILHFPTRTLRHPLFSCCRY